MRYPIAETFHSVQGEGYWTGTPMLFIRLAGCNVGEYAAIDSHLGVHMPNDFPLYQEKKHSVCTTYHGQQFLCDTDYHADGEAKTVTELVALLGNTRHACITGGEPFLHNLAPLVCAIQEKLVKVHIETSGTKPLEFSRPVANGLLWITMSPKKGMLDTVFTHAGAGVDEWKLLVGPFTTAEEVGTFAGKVPHALVYLQPINAVHSAWEDSLTNCLQLLSVFPQLRLSAQLHKYIHQR